MIARSVAIGGSGQNQVGSAARCIHRMDKVLTEGNVRLSSAVTDLSGAPSRATARSWSREPTPRKVSASGNSTGFGLVRFNPDGSIDTTFGTCGGAIRGFSKTTATIAFAVTLQPNGDIVALARYVGDGKLDSTFGNGGRVTTSFGSNADSFITSIVLQSDGKIVVAGTNAGTKLEVARYFGQ
jgi:uncharacterized delta-60 repeat protein